ncbi:MAG TPA: protein kinase [Gemmatimonadaceae bacterium]|nr:protein kinase [Gemmatimonadaceae bacterium]
MTEYRVDNTPRGWLRALYDWATGAATPNPDLPSSVGGASSPYEAPSRIGHYTIDHKLGQGGMGVVYAARDERLERTVAVKMMSSFADDDTARRRFWREARAAASVNHPNVCQLYEIGEDSGTLFIAMELLEGEALSTRLRRGPLSVPEATSIALAVLAALSALHARGIVHRDLKPSNVFLTPHGVKLLDFGLARPADPGLLRSLDSDANLTQTGMFVGSPGYMAPEQLTAEGLDARTDLFAVGAILFEMLAGRPAFSGNNFIDTLHATLHEQPPALTGSPAVAAVDRVIRRALVKHPADRPASADAMADELRAAQSVDGNDTATLARALTRIVVLPFRILRPDPETDFLAFSLPDAIATSLSSIASLVVRSSATAARFAGDAPDLKALAVEADVDRVVIGTLVRAGDQIRAAAQLVEAPGGTLLTSHIVQSPLGDLFHLQDDLARRVVDALALPLGRPDTSSIPAPRDPRAYEFYLRANELARSYEQLIQARSLYQRCLEIDPSFAPAWAQLARCHRVIGKYIEESPDSEDRAEAALLRALELNPRLSLAHKFYAQLEADIGKAPQALVRLLTEAGRHGNDPELFAGLVHTCRYCGLYEQSIAAHEEARRLDPNVPTSLEQTILMTGDVERLLAVEPTVLAASGDQGIRVIGLGLAGRREEARRGLAAMRSTSRLPLFQAWTDYLMAWLEERGSEMIMNISVFNSVKILEDPEAIFQEGWLLCDAGEHERGLSYLQRAVAKGYYVAPTLSAAPAFDALRSNLAFQAVVAEARAGRELALSAFHEHGGERLLGR